MVVALDYDYDPKNRKERSNKNTQRQEPNRSLRLPDVATVQTKPGSNNLEAGLFRQLTILGSPGV
jgi:hypothetical protein